jgi:hypothetical protein
MAISFLKWSCESKLKGRNRVDSITSNSNDSFLNFLLIISTALGILLKRKVKVTFNHFVIFRSMNQASKKWYCWLYKGD